MPGWGLRTEARQGGGGGGGGGGSLHKLDCCAVCLQTSLEAVKRLFGVLERETAPILRSKSRADSAHSCIVIITIGIRPVVW